MSKICSPRWGLPSRGSCISLTRVWISLSQYNVMVDYFSPTPFNSRKKPLIILKKLLQNIFLIIKPPTRRRVIVKVMTSLCHFRFVHNGVVGDNPLETSFWILIIRMDIRVWGRRKHYHHHFALSFLSLIFISVSLKRLNRFWWKVRGHALKKYHFRAKISPWPLRFFGQNRSTERCLKVR